MQALHLAVRHKVEKLMDSTYSSTHGPVPAFAAGCARDAIFPYMCLQRRWPLDEPGIPWHVDGGPSICFLAVTLVPWSPCRV